MAMATSGGTLALSSSTNSKIPVQNTDTFVILTSGQKPGRALFDNVASGARLVTADGFAPSRVDMMAHHGDAQQFQPSCNCNS